MTKNRLVINDLGNYEILSKKTYSSDAFISYLINYLNRIKPLFDRAKSSNEFEYACVLTGSKALQDPGWEPFDNTIKIFDSINKLKAKTKDEFTRLNLYLWLYGHIIEASQPYELYANLLRIIDGKPYSTNNFPEKQRGNQTIPQFPWEKIKEITELAKNVNMETTLDPLNDVFDKNLRNSIFHSDYSIHSGEIRAYKLFSKDETYLILNKVLAYFKCWKILFMNSISEYKESKVVRLPDRFSYDTGRLLVRKGYGLIGVKDNLKREQINHINLPFYMGKFKEHEIEILRIDPTINEMPFDKTEQLYNTYIKIYWILPSGLRKTLNRFYKKQLKRVQNKLIRSTVANIK